MTKSILQTNEDNEEQLKEILSSAAKSSSNKIDHRTATKPIISNMNSNDELSRGNDGETLPTDMKQSIREKSDRGSKMTYRLLTQGLFDNVGENIVLEFGRTEVDMTTSNVDFYFRELRLLNPKRFVLEGYANTSRSPMQKKMQIDYRFDKQQFYEAVYCANGTVRDMNPLKLDFAGSPGKQNVETARNIIKFLTMCLYSIEDVQTDISDKLPTKGETIKSKDKENWQPNQ